MKSKSIKRKVLGVSVLSVGIAAIAIGFLYNNYRGSEFLHYFAAVDDVADVKNYASFSFDGMKANVLSLEEKYKGLDWSYSLDGGANWTEASNDEVTFSSTELNSITDVNDILVSVAGESKVYKIDITNGKIPEGLYANDKENKIIGDKSNYEWKLEGDASWTKFSAKSPNLSGKKSLKVRSFSRGTELASSAVIYNFTEDSKDEKISYVAISNMFVESATKLDAAKNVIDGNANTSWIINGNNAELVLRLSQPMFISKIDYIGKAQRIEVSVSDDAKEWVSAATLNDIENNDERKSIELEEAVEAKYIKFDVVGHDERVVVSQIELYHDKTKTSGLVLDVDYDVTTFTNGNVIAQLIKNDDIVVTNNDGSERYTFTSNGEYTFEFKDSNGHTGVAVAKVDWIDKTAPTATVKYSALEATNQNVSASIIFSEPVEVKTTDDRLVKNEDGSYVVTFTENGSLELEFVDPVGNVGRTRLEVTCIDKKAPGSRVEYKNESEFGPVVATLILDEDGVVTNNDGKFEYVFEDNGSFVFEYRDLAGNTGFINAIVDWIKPHAKVEVKYSTLESTTGEVVATLVSDKVITITNNGGNSAFTFKENGEFIYTFVDEFGNNGVVVAKVSWIVKPSVGDQTGTGSTGGQSSSKPNSTSGSKTPNPSTTTKPSTPNSNGTSHPKDDAVVVAADEYKNYSVGSIGVKVPADAITEAVNLYSKNLSLDEIKGEYGPESEYLELYLENEKNQVYYLKNKIITIKFKLDDQKNFKGVYQVNDEGYLIKLDYGNESGNSISIKTNSLGKYLLSYDHLESAVPTPIKKKAAIKSFNSLVLVISGVIVVLAGVLFMVIRNKRNASLEVENDFYNDESFNK